MPGRNGLKIVMVGGGSFNWCPRLFVDLMQADELDGSQIVLLDPDLASAREVASAGQTMARSLGKSFRLVVTDSPTAAFRDCDFAIITISTGGLKSMAVDLAIPQKYGIFATVGDTVGPGGWCRALRNVPVLADMARQIERLSPHAVILNYTNPLSILTGAVSRSCSLRNVGLCHGVFETYAVLQAILGVEEKDLTVRFGGVNHFFWITDFTVNGQSGYPLLEKTLAGRSIDQGLTDARVDAKKFHAHHNLTDELYRQYGCLTYAADRHICEFFGGYVAPTPAKLEKYGIARTSIAERVAKRDENRKWCKGYATGRIAVPKRSRETAVDILIAISRGRPFVDVVNRPNEGQVENLPRGAVVETLGLVDSLGFRPVSSGPLPPLLAALVEPHCRTQLMTLEAALTGNRKLAIESLMADPQCSHLSPAQVRKMGTEMRDATAQWLPQFRTSAPRRRK